MHTSNRPVAEGDSTNAEPDIWMMRRTEGGWGEPEHLEPPINSPGAEYSPVTAANGTLYFASVRLGGQGQGDLYRSPLEEGAYRQVFPLNAPINSPTGEWSIEVDPRERFILFDASQRAENLSLFSDLYLAYRQADGLWGAPMNLRRLNSHGLNILPRISPDGVHLYFSNTDSMGSANADILVTSLGSLLNAYRAPVTNDAVLVVANQSGHTVALIDPETYTLLGSLPVGKGPHEVVVSGSTVFVANYGVYPEVPDGSASRTLTWKTEVTNTVTVLDVERRVVVATHHLENCTNPHGIAAGEDGTRFWVTCENHETLLELDAATGASIKRWPTKQARSHMVLHDAAQQKLFVANGNAGSVTVIDRSTDQVQVVPTGAGAEGMALAPDGRTLWVLNGQANTITLIDTETDRVVKSMPIRFDTSERRSDGLRRSLPTPAPGIPSRPGTRWDGVAIAEQKSVMVDNPTWRL